jgi:peptidoglycan/xylan/chitin deacetylase (PgdA/CDA1 family)
MDHRPWRRLPPAAREREFVEARERISDVVGSAVDEAAVPLGLYDRRSLTELKRLGYTAVHTSERMVGKVGEWLQPRFSVRAYDTVQTMKSDALADPARVQRAWLVAKSHVKRLR